VNRRGELLSDVWRTEDRLHTDDATIAKLCQLASDDPSIRAIVDDLQPDQPGNGSVWAVGKARNDDTPVLLKLGARETERDWMTAAEMVNNVVPRIFGAGEMRGVGWLVLEQCEFMLDRNSPAHVTEVVKSCTRYQHAAATDAIPAIHAPSMDLDWVLENLDGAQAQDCPGDLSQMRAEAPRSWDLVTALCGTSVNHGDVHFGNVVARGADGPALLIDAMPITTVWAWDAAYLEGTCRQPGVVQQFELARRAIGLPSTNQIERVAQIALGWVAAYWWRIAPWRHDNEIWRGLVESWMQASRW
jgi:hypothetical protein